MTDLDAWPALPYEAWAPTRKALHLYAQMLGKLKLALNPPLPEWLHASLALDARGLATGPLAHGGRVVEAGIDLFDNVLWVRAGGDPAIRIALAGGRSVAQVWADFQEALARLGVTADLWDKPQELAGATPFSSDAGARVFDGGQARRFHSLLAMVDGAFEQFRSRFFGRTGVQFWWGTFDLAVLLFSGRQVTPPEDRGYIMRYDLDAEHLNAGFWPGDDSAPRAIFYAYIHPRPDGCETVPIEPEKAGWVDAMGQWILPYDEVRASADPQRVLLDFLRSAYRAAVTIGGWDEGAYRYALPAPSRRSWAPPP
ncbi:MAG: DUF5996 family protein [Thermoleophilia bacterium]